VRGATERRAPATLAEIDLAALREPMTTKIEKAKAEDPQELRKTIRDFQSELKKA
jgi:hypothetical protein